MNLHINHLAMRYKKEKGKENRKASRLLTLHSSLAPNDHGRISLGNEIRLTYYCILVTSAESIGMTKLDICIQRLHVYISIFKTLSLLTE